jgi:ribonuclease P protein component
MLRFPKAARLTRASEFRRVKEQGQSFHGRFIVLNVLKIAEPSQSPSQPLQAARIGFITSRRVGSAVVRNRVRRRLRELARLKRPQLRDGVWLVLIARASAVQASFQALERDWSTLARRAAILQEPA